MNNKIKDKKQENKNIDMSLFIQAMTQMNSEKI